MSRNLTQCTVSLFLCLYLQKKEMPVVVLLRFKCICQCRRRQWGPILPSIKFRMSRWSLVSCACHTIQCTASSIEYNARGIFDSLNSYFLLCRQTAPVPQWKRSFLRSSFPTILVNSFYRVEIPRTGWFSTVTKKSAILGIKVQMKQNSCFENIILRNTMILWVIWNYRRKGKPSSCRHS